MKASPSSGKGGAVSTAPLHVNPRRARPEWKRLSDHEKIERLDRDLAWAEKRIEELERELLEADSRLRLLFTDVGRSQHRLRTLRRAYAGDEQGELVLDDDGAGEE